MNRIPSTGVPVVPAAMNTSVTAVPVVDAGAQAETRNGAGPTSQREYPKGFTERTGLPFTYQQRIEHICPSCGGKDCTFQGCR